MSFFGINLASRSLQADQLALEITGQNITNADVPGYSRQVAIFSPVAGPGASVPELAGSPVAPGGGVDVSTVQRTHAAWLDAAAAQLSAQSGQASIDDQSAQQLQSLLAEPTDAGLSATTDRFLTAFGNLASHPEDPAARDGVLRAAQDLTGRFQQLSQGLQSLGQSISSQAGQNVATINDLANQVAALNDQISQAQAAGAAPNELLDQRDQLLQQLQERAGATVSGQEGGELMVSIGGINLVQGTHAESLSLSSGSPAAVVVAGTGAPVTAPGGQLGAQLNWVNTVLPGYQSRLNSFRDGLAAAVNKLHESGSDATGAAGQPIFVTDAGGNLAVNPALVSDPSKVVAGDGSAGNSGVALAISNLSSASGGLLAPYQRLVADIGSQASESQTRSQQADASRQQIQEMQNSESGVNLDEELAQMVSLQHAYSASARLLSTYDQMLTTLVAVGT